MPVHLLFALTCFEVQAAQPLKPFRLPDAVISGRYYQGDGLGVNHVLTLRKDHRFSYQGHTDAGASETNKGHWGYEGDVVVLKPDGANDPHNWTGTSTRFIPVRWGDAVTLVEEAAAPGFFATKNQDSAALDSTHSLDYRKLKATTFDSIARTGPMQYPPRFSDFVAHGPIFATVASVNDEGTVYVKTSTPKRLRVGTLLTTDDWSGVDVQITKVDPKGATGTVGYFLNSRRAIRLGDKLTTGGRYVTPHERGDTRLPSPTKRKN